jgi:hypothetical protein
MMAGCFQRFAQPVRINGHRTGQVLVQSGPRFRGDAFGKCLAQLQRFVVWAGTLAALGRREQYLAREPRVPLVSAP